MLPGAAASSGSGSWQHSDVFVGAEGAGDHFPALFGEKIDFTLKFNKMHLCQINRKGGPLYKPLINQQISILDFVKS